MDIISAMGDAALFASFFEGSSWDNWRIVLKAVDALPMSLDEIKFFADNLSGGRVPPETPCREVFILAGRRSGKSKVASAKAIHSALFQDHSYLSKGESAQVSVVSWSRSHAKVILNYCRAFLEPPLLAGEVSDLLSETIRLKNGLEVKVETCRHTASRGFSTVFAIMEESSFWRESGPHRDEEVYRSILPSTATTDGRLVSISTPYASIGLNYNAWRESYGVADKNRLVLQAPSLLLNPLLDESWVREQLERDPIGAKSEFEAQFRTDVSSYLGLEDIESAIELDMDKRPPVSELMGKYSAFCDISGGKSDSSVLCISHADDSGILWLDLIYEESGQHSPTAFIETASGILSEYGVNQVWGDRYSAGFAQDCWAENNIHFRASEHDKSGIYREFLPLLLSGRCRLLDNPKMVRQFAGLERKVSSGGKDRIDHTVGGKDDISNACAGSIVHARAPKNFDEIMWISI